jgi:tRNA (adenine-N(1)-)-methyltransferase non-catalytic subunit
MRNNRLTVDDASRQALSMAEIEELKKAGAGSGKEIIAKIMASHNAIDEKTSFSLAKYTLRKSRKYMKRFTALPLDVGLLTEYVIEKEAYKIMELREDLLGLINSWANIHSGEGSRVSMAEDGVSQIGGGRWLVVDDTGGLVTAALAEKMGILYPEEEEDDSEEEAEAAPESEAMEQVGRKPSQQKNGTAEAPSAPEPNGEDTALPNPHQQQPPHQILPHAPESHRDRTFPKCPHKPARSPFFTPTTNPTCHI